MLGIGGTGDRPPDKRPAFQEISGGSDGPGLMVWRSIDGAVVWVPLP